MMRLTFVGYAAFCSRRGPLASGRSATRHRSLRLAAGGVRAPTYLEGSAGSGRPEGRSCRGASIAPWRAARSCSRAHPYPPAVPAAGRFGIYGVSDQG
jgi:hypothetical protein